jgi:hypothetical protein
MSFEGYDDGIYDHPVGTYDGDMPIGPSYDGSVSGADNDSEELVGAPRAVRIGAAANSLVEV